MADVEEFAAGEPQSDDITVLAMTVPGELAGMAKVLLVEDNEMNRDMLSRRLMRQGFEVVVAVDGQAGVDAARAGKPDIVLMDMSLPVLDGWEATRQLKSQDETRAIPVIALTAHAMAGDRQQALDAGCDDYDTKPIELPRLLEKMRRCSVEASEAMSAALSGDALKQLRHDLRTPINHILGYTDMLVEDAAEIGIAQFEDAAAQDSRRRAGAAGDDSLFARRGDEQRGRGSDGGVRSTLRSAGANAEAVGGGAGGASSKGSRARTRGTISIAWWRPSSG